jgi:hypothetical protein
MTKTCVSGCTRGRYLSGTTPFYNFMNYENNEREILNISLVRIYMLHVKMALE